jgi:hypothetical protein
MNRDTAIDKKNEADVAVDRAIGSFIKSRKEKVPHFVKRWFSFRGAVQLNKKALGSDLFKAPANLMWALPYTGLKVSSSAFKRVGLGKISSHMERLPVGFETHVQKEVTWLILTELLEIPYVQGKRESSKDALLEEIIRQPEISSLIHTALFRIQAKSRRPGFRRALEENLLQYSRSRTAAADLAGSIISLSAGAAVFHQMTPGAITAGGALATTLAHHAAVSNFVLGSSLGSIYYTAFPATASMSLIIAATGSILAALAILTSFSGIITDPIQYKLGIHQKRLHKLIDCLDRELRGRGDSKFKIRDQYVARVFDLLDLFKKAAGTLI